MTISRSSFEAFDAGEIYLYRDPVGLISTLRRDFRIDYPFSWESVSRTTAQRLPTRYAIFRVARRR